MTADPFAHAGAVPRPDGSPSSGGSTGPGPSLRPSRPRCARRAPRLLPLLLLGFAAGLPAQESSGPAWLPVPAESLQGIVDGIERARGEGEPRRERAALERLAQALLEQVPDGGFPTGAGRWTGPGAYLRAAAAGLPPDERTLLIDAIDLLVEARLEREPAFEEIERWLRDLPLSDRFDPLRAEVAARALEEGRLDTWVEQTRRGAPAGVTLERSTLERWLRSRRPMRAADSLGQPLHGVLRVGWPEGTDDRSPWSDGGLQVEPVVTADRVHFATPDGVHCWDTVGGRELWFFPFAGDSPPLLPGSLRRPVLCGPTLIVTTERGVVGLDRESGATRFRLSGRELFAPSPAGKGASDEGTAAQAPSSRSNPILAIGAPILTEIGALLVVARDLEGTLDLRLLHIDPDGEVLWSRDAGSALGSGYLALSSVIVPPRTRGDTALIASGRGSLLCHSLLDGALAWAAPYPAYAPTAQQDALRALPARREAKLERLGGSALLTTRDSSGLHVIDPSDGRVRFRIPLGAGRWWCADFDEAGRIELLIAGEREWSAWTIPDADRRGESPTCLGEFVLDPALPSFTGPPEPTSAGWWLPHRSGAYSVGEGGAITAAIEVHTEDTIRRVLPTGTGMLIIGEGSIELRQPCAAEPDSLLHWWPAIARGEWSVLPDPLPAIPTEAGIERRRDEEEIARTILLQLRRPGVEAEIRRRLVPAALGRILRADERTRATVAEGEEAARRGEGPLAVELCWLALRIGDPDASIDRPGVGPVELEVAIHAILAGLRDGEERLPLQDELELRARAALRSLPSDRIDARLELARLHPGTAVGRRVSLEAAEQLYRFGNLRASIELLESLVLFEPLNAEAVEARLRIVELAAERGDRARALQLISELSRDFGDLPLEVSTPDGPRTVTVRERATALARRIPEGETKRRDAVALPLEPVWRARTELDHIRNLRVTPLLDGERYLTVSRRSLGVRIARTGERVWHRTLPRSPTLERIPSWSDIGRFTDPIAIDEETFWISDRREILQIRLSSGEVLRRHSLPPIETEEGESTIQGIERAQLAEGHLLLVGEGQTLHVLELKSGAQRWQRPLPGPLEGPLSVRDGRILLGLIGPASVQIWSLEDGSTIGEEDLSWRGARLAQEPCFAPIDDGDPTSGNDIIIAESSGTLRRVDLATGEERWSHTFPSRIRAIHRAGEPRFWTAELLWSRVTPTLVGFDPESGELLWQKTFAARRRPLHQLLFADDDLYFVEGDYNRRVAGCLEVPRAFADRGAGPARELRTRWTTPLAQSWDVPKLSLHQDWLIVVDTLSCELTFISREVGLPIPPRDGFEAAYAFLPQRQRLDFAGFIDGTLVLETARGALGLRAIDPVAERAELWRRLRGGASGGAGAPAGALTDASRAFRRKDPETALRIVGEAVERPSLDLARRARLLESLEAYGEAVGESGPPQWRIPRLESPPRIDGSLGEAWNAANAWLVEHPRYFHPIQGSREDSNAWQGRRDLSALLLAGWSDEGFHLALDVTDDSIQAYDGEADDWIGDCLLLALDLLGDGGARAGPDDQLFTLALVVPRRQAPGGPPPGGGGDPADGDAPPPGGEEEEDDRPEGTFQVLRKADNSGVVYEATIPWSTFQQARDQLAVPHPGMSFRMNLLLTDDDSGRGATSYLSLTTGQMLRDERSAVWDVFAPERFPRIILGR